MGIMHCGSSQKTGVRIERNPGLKHKTALCADQRMKIRPRDSQGSTTNNYLINNTF